MRKHPLACALATLALAASLRGQEAAVKAADAFIKKWDTNGNYWVSFEEFNDKEAFKKQDKNGDGRITVADFLQKDKSSGQDSMMMMTDRETYRYLGFQTIPKYDRDHDGFLDEAELKFLLITVMDFDEDRVLHASEIKHSRTPPGLALEEGWFAKDAKAWDLNGDGVITAAEMRVPEVVMKGLDKNKDGRISIEELARAQVVIIGGYVPKFQELAEIAGKLGKLDKANWVGDPELFHKIDEDHDSVVSLAEFDRYTRSLKTVLSMCPDFITRYDLDGDQKVARREFPGADSMFERMDKNRDGFVTAQDR
jgi:Ca2+-binding EF-hand superfamily protein